MNHIPVLLFPLPETTIDRRIILTNIIEDKGSKYIAVADLFTDEKVHKSWISNLKKDKYFVKATHNTGKLLNFPAEIYDFSSYVWRVKLQNGSIVESFNDDGEIGAGQIILREMQRVNAVNMIIVVTRYFGGVMLHGDRFRHVVDATKKVLLQIGVGC